MENENETLDSLNENKDVIALDESDDIDAVKEKFEKLSEQDKKTSESNKQLFSRAKKAESFELKDGDWVKKETPKETPKVDPGKDKTTADKTGELDETQLDFLDLKGITEDEDIGLIESIVAKTGKTVRQALKDDYVISKLESLKSAREVKDATPSSTKRTGVQGDTVDAAIAKYEQTGEYPDDYELRSKVINKIEEKHSFSVPGYRKGFQK